MTVARRPLLLAGAVLALTAAAAFAWWLGSGSGSGDAATDGTVPVTLTPGTPEADLGPGGSADVTLEVFNDQEPDVKLAGLVLDSDEGDGGIGVDAGHPDCPGSAVSYATQDNDGNGWDLDGGQTLPIVLPDALTMASDAPNACQGATFEVYLRGVP